MQRKDPTWYATVASVDSELMAAIPNEHDPSALEELACVLDWACDHHVIAAADRQLVLLLLEASQHLRLRRTSTHGLLGRKATATVAAQLGVCERTIRRRASRTVRADRCCPRVHPRRLNPFSIPAREVSANDVPAHFWRVR